LCFFSSNVIFYAKFVSVMSAIGINIKKIRSVKGLNQTDFAKLFGLTRANIGSYEELRAEPKIETIIKIATYYKLKIDDLVKKELTVNQISNFNALEKLVLPLTEKKKGFKFIDKDLLEKYPNKKESKAFLSSLPLIDFPFGRKKVEKCILYNDGNDLHYNNEGFLHGDLLFLEKVNIDSETFLGVIITNEAIYKGMLSQIGSKIEIIPLNPNAIKQTVTFTKNIECWKIVGKYSTEVISKVTIRTKVDVLEKKIATLQKELE